MKILIAFLVVMISPFAFGEAFLNEPVSITSEFQPSAAPANKLSCDSSPQVPLQSELLCGNLIPVRISWNDRSFEDWDGAVLRMYLSVEAQQPGTLSGTVHFYYSVKPGWRVLALKSSQGAKDILFHNQETEFTDQEGRRIVSVADHQVIDVEVPFEFEVTGGGKEVNNSVSVELEFAEAAR